MASRIDARHSRSSSTSTGILPDLDDATRQRYSHDGNLHQDGDDSGIPLMMIGGEDASIEPKHEMALVSRLDRQLLLFAMLGNLVKALDNNNLGSAFISGMEEELAITGLQYNWMGVLFMSGYLAMQIPSNMLLARMNPSSYLPALEFVWSILTVAMACVQSVQSVYVIRFLLGLAEAGFYPGIVFLLGTWYTKRELGKRMAFLTICHYLGAGVSGIVQVVMLKTMDGALGVSGWRWMFLFDASLTLVLAWYGRKNLPDYPHNTPWLNAKERDLAMRRLGSSSPNTGLPASMMGSQGLAGSRVGPSPLWSLLSNKYMYLFVITWATIHISLGACTVMGIVAKKLGYGAVTANLLGTPDTLLTMAAGLCNGFISDRMRSRFWCVFCPMFLALFGCSMLSLFVQPFSLLYASFICTHVGLGATTSVIMTWASEVISKDIRVRALAIATMNTCSSMMWLWAPLVLWPVTDAPRYHTGFSVSALCIILAIMSVSLIGYFQAHDMAKGARRAGGRSMDSATWRTSEEKNIIGR